MKATKKKPTPKMVLKAMVANGGKIEPAVISAGLSEGYARSGKFQKTKGWQELIEKYIPEEDLLRVHKEGLAATKKQYTQEDVVEEPDFPTRHRYLETGYKVRGRMKEQDNSQKTLIINISGETAKRYGLTPKPSTGSD